MKWAAQQLFEYVETKNHFELQTENGITITIADAYSLIAEYTILKLDAASLEINLSCGKRDFARVLKIKHAQDIYSVTPDRLMELYDAGIAEIVCLVDLNYSCALSFRKVGNTILAGDDKAVKHQVPANTVLKTPEQFIAYTKQYYKPLEINEN